jgi:hypothetical protein
MKSRRLSEVNALIASPEFRGWTESLSLARTEHHQAREKHEELLSQAMLMDFRAELAQKNAIDTLYRAGELEDGAAEKLAEIQTLENAGFKLVADFEEQRYRSRDSWARAGAAERALEQGREQLAAARAALAGSAKPREAQADIGRLEAELRRRERALAQSNQENDRETGVKNRLWAEVEKNWERSMELSLLVAEQRLQGKRVRTEAEALFKQAEERKGRAAGLRREAEQVARERESARVRVSELLKQAAERFGCAIGEDFVYWSQKENPKRAWSAALVEDSQSYNIEVGPLAVYDLDVKRGVEFVEPAVEAKASDEEGDRRFEEYFLQGRKGLTKPTSGEQQTA